MRVYGFFSDYSGHEIDCALSKLSSSEYRLLSDIFEDKGINRSKYNGDRNNFSTSVILKFTNILEENRRNGIISLNDLTLKIMDLVNIGKSNKEICNILNIDYSVLYYELKKVRDFERNYDRDYFDNGIIIGKEDLKKNNKLRLNVGNKNNLRILVISDLHFGNNLENIEAVKRAFNYAKKRGINIIICCGDFVDGAFSKGRQNVERYFKQFEHFALDYPYDKEITTFGVGGNHDHSIKFSDGFDFIKFCKMYRDDVVVNSYGCSVLDIKDDSILMCHDVKGIQRQITSSSIILSGHIHKYDVHYIRRGNYLNIFVPTLSNLVQVVPEVLELELSFADEIIENVHIKEVCFGNQDIILSEKDYCLSKNNEELSKENSKVKEIGKRSSQIDKFNKRYGL